MQEFNIRTLLERVRLGWHTPLAFAAVLAAFTLSSLVGSRPTYRVTMTVVPAPSDQGGQSALSSGALTSILGLAGGGNVNFGRYEKLLSSTIVAQRLQDRYGLLQKVFSGNWDATRKVWVPHFTTREYLLRPLLLWSNLPIWAPPDATALARYLESAITIIPGVGNDIVSISMDSPDVEFAKRVMLETHEQANEVLRDQVARRARLQVDYLEGKLAQTSVEDYRATLLVMLGNQQKTLMLAQTDASYAAEILSPPIAAPTPVGPRPVLGMFISILTGILCGLGVVIFLGPYWWRPILDRIDFRKSINRRTAAANR